MNYNNKYIFISRGDQFEEGAEVYISHGHNLWRNYPDDDSEISYDEMLEKKNKITGIFCEDFEDNIEGETMCPLSDFEIVKR